MIQKTIDHLQEFRRDLYNCFPKRRDAIMNLLDSIRPKWWERVIPAMSAIKPLLQKGLNKVLKTGHQKTLFLEAYLISLTTTTI